MYLSNKTIRKHVTFQAIMKLNAKIESVVLNPSISCAGFYKFKNIKFSKLSANEVKWKFQMLYMLF